jgi:hypothetical protein
MTKSMGLSPSLEAAVHKIPLSVYILNQINRLQVMKIFVLQF